MAEVVANTGVSKDKGYLYYLGKDGNVWRSQMARAGKGCLLYTSPSPRDLYRSRMPSSA